jgi:hypothetical protein
MDDNTITYMHRQSGKFLSRPFEKLQDTPWYPYFALGRDDAEFQVKIEK